MIKEVQSGENKRREKREAFGCGRKPRVVEIDEPRPPRGGVEGGGNVDAHDADGRKGGDKSKACECDYSERWSIVGNDIAYPVERNVLKRNTNRPKWGIIRDERRITFR